MVFGVFGASKPLGHQDLCSASLAGSPGKGGSLGGCSQPDLEPPPFAHGSELHFRVGHQVEASSNPGGSQTLVGRSFGSLEASWASGPTAGGLVVDALSTLQSLSNETVTEGKAHIGKKFKEITDEDFLVTASRWRGGSDNRQALSQYAKNVLGLKAAAKAVPKAASPPPPLQRTRISRVR